MAAESTTPVKLLIDPLKDAIARVVAAGGTVEMPIPIGEPMLDRETLDTLDRQWAQHGIRVTHSMNSTYFPRRVQELRRKYGMPYHSSFRDRLVFEPEPAECVEVAHV